ncbi:aldehyde dehydrogenase family protein [Micromonospora craniellae]|uniref:Aldehyde dehydrogenase family protein n=1 Tax=Micromonospora craniellae TaxID=2294034 RepID=A0A372G2W6_9ACTN|nr:aldehyde dehydrogenase family protein [Micromonospora craniellae]QOC92141.1 aldehyde dehydrogenase family protein [Micromonospora craniellae]RFS47401.1 aldehyde dehydrogenase family protein [Micromonospora craniellae]
MGQGLYVDGRWRAASDGGTAGVVNPATEAVIVAAPVGTVADAADAVAAAHRAFHDGRWSGLVPADRAAALRRLRQRLGDRIGHHVALSVAESGAPHGQSTAFVTAALAHLEYAIDVATGEHDRMLPPPPRPAGGPPRVTASLVRRVPVGVVAALTPYNAPLMLTLPKVAAALTMGNTVVVKPSPYTPLEILALAEAADEAGIPPGVLNVVTGGAEVGAALTGDPRVDLVTFTGSDAVGARVMAQAARNVTRVVLELGGKSALVVRADADLAMASRIGAVNTTTLAGQGCALLTRHLVHRDMFAGYVAALAERLSTAVLGDPAHEQTTLGPLISAAHRDRVSAAVQAAKARGARAVVDGGPVGVGGRGFFHEPVVLTGVGNDDPVARQEIFGPVAVVLPFDTDEEAVTLANDSPYGLAGAVVSADRMAAVAVAERLRAGRVSVNDGATADVRLPFGGFGRSGIGREFGLEGVLEYTEVQTLQW